MGKWSAKFQNSRLTSLLKNPTKTEQSSALQYELWQTVCGNCWVVAAKFSETKDEGRGPADQAELKKRAKVEIDTKS